jgi:hypothetical protein
LRVKGEVNNNNIEGDTMENAEGHRIEQDEENGRWLFLEGPNAGHYISEAKMTKREARQILLPYHVAEIRDVVDKPGVTQAILTIHPHFVFSDWSTRLVASILVKAHN